MDVIFAAIVVFAPFIDVDRSSSFHGSVQEVRWDEAPHAATIIFRIPTGTKTVEFNDDERCFQMEDFGPPGVFTEDGLKLTIGDLNPGDECFVEYHNWIPEHIWIERRKVPSEASFDQIQEAWVAGQVGPENYAKANPAWIAERLERLGSDSWRVRELETRQLEAMAFLGWPIRPCLCWGLLHPDPEVRVRSARILRRCGLPLVGFDAMDRPQLEGP